MTTGKYLNRDDPDKRARFRSLLIRHCSFLLIVATAECLISYPTDSLSQWTPHPGGRLSLYSDVEFSDSTLSDGESRVVDVYVVHRVITGDNADAIRFKLSASQGFTGTWLADVPSLGFIVVGTSPSGIALGYNACRTGEVLLLSVRFQLLGTSSPCSYLELVPYPGVPYIEAMNCTFESLLVDGGRLLVGCPVPVRSTTWGNIKSLYR